MIYFYFLTVGELVCPAYHELCSKDSVSVSGKCPNTCNFNGDCVDGKCFCFLGYHGHDCSKREHLFLSCITSFYVLMFACSVILANLFAGSCPNNCSGHGRCLSSGLCECGNGYTGIDCSTGNSRLTFLELLEVSHNFPSENYVIKFKNGNILYLVLFGLWSNKKKDG